MLINNTVKILLCRKKQLANRYVIGYMLAALVIANTGCSTAFRQMRDGLQPRVLVTKKNEEKANLYNEIGLAQRTRAEAYIQILGSDVELPPTASTDQTSDVRKYYFDVWVDQTLIPDLKKGIESGELVIDVTNAKATFEEVSYGNSLYTKIENKQQAKTNPQLTSKSIIRVVVDSRDITQSFTIIAKLKTEAGKFESERQYQLNLALSEYKIAAGACVEKCRAGKENGDTTKFARYEKARERAETILFEQNPNMATRVVKVFNGDLHTQVYMLSDTETKDAFGSNFARSFYVGKAYLRNRHTKNKLIVHTTSLRARTLFYREPQTADGTSKAGFFGSLEFNPGDGPSAKESSEARDYLYVLSENPEPALPPLTKDQENRIKNSILESQRMKIIRADNPSMTDAKLAETVVDEVLPKISGSPQDITGSPQDIKRRQSTREFAIPLTIDLIVIARKSANLCFGENELEQEKNILAEKFADEIFTIARSRDINFSSSDAKEKEKLAIIAKCFMDELDEGISRTVGLSSPIALDMRRRVGLTKKIAASSQDTRWQEKLSRHGYFWEDFYRPMTFESVLLSLTARTRAHPMNRTLEYLESLGVVAGALVGMEQISSAFGGEAFAQRVAVSTGVFVPEMKKLLLRDIDQYLGNLASTALPSIVTLAPNESRDGYVFFPRGPIYGYGVDEFSINEPSFIVNIDNEDVSVDGALIEGEVQFSAGQQAAANTLVDNARSQGEKQVSEQLTKLADLEAKLFAYRTRHIVSVVCEMLDRNKFTEAGAYLGPYKVKNKDEAKDNNAAIQDLLDRINAKIKCDQTLPENSSSSG